MALPLVPLAGLALRYVPLALAVAVVVGRSLVPGRTDQRAEDAMDDLAEGLATHRPRDRRQMNAAARLRRVVRLGANGPGVEIDAAVLGRLRFRRL
ncbi:MAG: hypothetical protein IT545_01820 [Rhodobacteraceae bacterium]|nr:hypothetical protein [Paracoccaceae bacterium]